MSVTFHELVVTEVRRETADAVSIAFDVPEPLANTFAFAPGQYLTLRCEIGGEDVRRTYSICSARGEPLRVAVKHVHGGRFSTFANRELTAGDTLAVLPPTGMFVVPAEPSAARHHVAFAAGSGITPVLALVTALLRDEPRSRVTLCYGNRTTASILFREALCELKNRYMSRFAVHHFLSGERQAAPLYDGRIDGSRLSTLLDVVLPPTAMDTVVVCGPGTMTDEVSAALVERGCAPEVIRTERFGVPTQAAGRAEADREASAFTAGITLYGTRTEVHGRPGDTILDAAQRAGLELPYACRGGVCATCRALVTDGGLDMSVNYSLAPWETERGFVLTCQAHPRDPHVEIDFDQT